MTMTTLQLGNGDVAIASLNSDKGMHGVVFFANPGGETGAPTGHGGRRSEETEVMFLEISSTSKESIQVLINKLEESKTFFDLGNQPKEGG